MDWTCRLLVEEQAHSGIWNMAVDEWMLNESLRGESVLVRIYEWDEPTISLGYFQRDTGTLPAALQSLPGVRRVTGGGAILHDRELTYSIAVPARHPAARPASGLYDLVHEAIIQLLRESGVECSQRGDSLAAGDEPFLCFLRQDPRDIVAASCKIVGSAQRRRNGCVLQHGSMLLQTSDLVPELKGITDLVDHFDESQFRSEVGQRIAGLFAGTPVTSVVSNAEELSVRTYLQAPMLVGELPGDRRRPC